jgi:hypothetical protein
MIDSVVVTNLGEEATPSAERLDVVEDEDLGVDQGQQGHGKNPIRYYNRRQQLELVLAAQEMSEVDVHKINLTSADEAEQGGSEMKGTDIWQDTTCLALLREGVLLEVIDVALPSSW